MGIAAELAPAALGAASLVATGGADAPLILGLAGAATSAIGQIGAGQAASANAAYQAQIAKNNQLISTQNANYATQAGESQAAATSMKGAAQLANIKASQAANNVDVNSGSALGVQESQSETNTLNTENVMNNALLQAYGYKASAANYGAQAAVDTATAAQAGPAADIGALGSLASSASSIGFKFNGQNGNNGTTVYTGADNPNNMKSGG